MSREPSGRTGIDGARGCVGYGFTRSCSDLGLCADGISLRAARPGPLLFSRRIRCVAAHAMVVVVSSNTATKTANAFATPYHALTASPFQGASAHPRVMQQGDGKMFIPGLKAASVAGSPRLLSLEKLMPYSKRAQLLPLVLPNTNSRMTISAKKMFGSARVQARGDTAPAMRRSPRASTARGVLLHHATASPISHQQSNLPGTMPYHNQLLVSSRHE